MAEAVNELNALCPAYVERDEGILGARVRENAEGFFILSVRYVGCDEFREELRTPSAKSLKRYLTLVDAGDEQPVLDDKAWGPGEVPEGDDTPADPDDEEY